MASPDPTTIGRYEVVSRLGQGGMGSLYLAKDPKIGRLVAIKLVRQEFDSPDARQRFAREAQSAGTLRHPNIVTIFDVDEHDGLPFIAMEYIDGETLAEIVKRKALLPLAKRIQWVEDLCSGLAYAHRQGVIHRDIKPANLMVDTEGSLKILDFGLARRDSSKFTQSHVIIGTPNYMSPEQIRGGNIDTRSDIFSVGALLYEVLTYKEAFPGAVHQTMHKILHEEPEPIEILISSIDPSVPKILRRALVKDRDGRYPDLSLMKADLAEARQRMENAPLADAATMPLDKGARFQVAPTETMRPPSPHGGTASRPRSSGSSKRYQTNRQSLQRRRSEQITALLDEARKLFEAGDLDKARDTCDQALMFDPDHPGGLQLMDDIATEADRKQVAQWIAEARGEMQKGQLDRAEALVAQARQLQPESQDVQQLQEAIDTTRREIERTRQIQETMRRARARFAEGGYEAAIRAAGEVLAIDPENVSAKDLQKRAQDAIEHAATRTERDAAAQSAVASARKLFESGDKDSAIRQLESFAPKHDLVSAFLATLKGEKVPEPEPSARTGGETAHILRGARGPTPDLPARRNFLVAAAVFSVAIVAATLYFRPWEDPAPAPANTTAAATDPALEPAGNATANAAPVVPPPLPPVSAPVMPVNTEPSADDKDIQAAYNAINNDDIPRAQQLAAAIRKRNPKHPLLATLNTTIDTRIADLKKREDAVAEAAKTSAALEEEKKRSAAAVKEAEEAKATANAATITALPGGGFVAPSEPPSPALRGEAERPDIENLVKQWAAALGTRNVAAISNIRSFTKDEAENWQRLYRNYKQIEVNAKVTANPVVVDDDALVEVEEIMIMTQNNGIKLTGAPRRTSYRMHKVGGQWRMLPPAAPMPKRSGSQ